MGKPSSVREPTPEEFVALKRDAAQNVLDASKALQGDAEALLSWRKEQPK